MRKTLRVLLLACLTFAATSSALAQGTSGPVYIVQPDDTLSLIASRFNISLEDLLKANDISDPNLISAGQELVIPGLEGVSGVLDTQLINLGDSYRSLMRRTHVDEALFRRLNRLVSPTELYVGAPVILPRQEAPPQYAGLTPSAGESLLELAAADHTDTWTISALNDLAGSWDGLPGDVLYAPGSQTGETVGGLPSAFVSAEITTLPIKQGGTVEVVVKTPPDTTLGGTLVDFPLHFFPLPDGSQAALQGVDALLDPGIYPLRLDATLPGGSHQSYEQMVLINSGNYASEIIPLNDPTTIDPAVTEPELKQIQQIVSGAGAERFWSGIFTAPSAYPDCFTSRYGTRRTYTVVNTTTELPGFHTGLDFCGGEGLPITAPADGRVVFAGPLTVRGNATIVDHGWGIYSGFWHQSEIRVQPGEMVKQGQLIGLVGGTGRVTGAHLHWEVWVNGVQVNPLDWLNRSFP
ncbi:MAG: peptidoglycan DD-metalloendopeptidase family protein [Bacteroidota bacterium]